MDNRLCEWIRHVEEGLGRMEPEELDQVVADARARGERLAQIARDLGEAPPGGEEVAADLVEALDLMARALETLEREALGEPSGESALGLAEEAEDLLQSVDYRVAELQQANLEWQG